MRLEDLLSILDENMTVNVNDMKTGDDLARYDGRDSIPTELNDCKVCAVFVSDRACRVYIEQ